MHPDLLSVLAIYIISICVLVRGHVYDSQGSRTCTSIVHNGSSKDGSLSHDPFFLRGGSAFVDDSTMNDTESDEEAIEESKMAPTPHAADSSTRKTYLLDPLSVSTALRLTCEINRRLAIASDPAHSWRNDEASIFFTSPSNRIPLLCYIEKIYNIFDYGSIPLIPALTLIYLDRACSIETIRHSSYPGDQPISCPYLNQSNIHKLFLSANILAMRSYRNELPTIFTRGAFHDNITHQYLQMIQTSSDVPEPIKEMTTSELGNMLEWMAASFGLDGPAVNIEEVNTFIHNWNDMFDRDNNIV